MLEFNFAASDSGGQQYRGEHQESALIKCLFTQEALCLDHVLWSLGRKSRTAGGGREAAGGLVDDTAR